MGLIRKTLAVGTVGLVNPSSKKQRVARATMKNTAAAAKAAEQHSAIAQQQAATAQQQVAIEQQRVAVERQRVEMERQRQDQEHAFRYDTDLVYKEWWDKKEAERRAAAEAAAEARRQQIAAHRAAEAEAQQAALAEAERLWQWQAARSERRKHERQVFATRVLVGPVLVAAIAMVALGIWLPQVAIATARRQSPTFWRRQQLTDRWQHLVKLGRNTQ